VQKYNDFKVLLVGASGMLGSYYYKKTSKIFNVFPTSSSDQEYKFLDIRDSVVTKKILSELDPNIIINCCAYTNVDGAEQNKKHTYDLNVGGIKNLIKYSSNKTKIVHISTDYIFDGKLDEYNELSLPNPLNYYGKTKLEAENILRSSNRKFLIFRINGLFSFKNENFYTWVLDSLNNSSTIDVVDDQISNPTYIDSFVDVINQCIILDAEGIFHYGTKNNISRYDFAKIIAKKNKLNVKMINSIKTKKLNQIAERPLKTYLDCKKIEDFLKIDLLTIECILDKK